MSHLHFDHAGGLLRADGEQAFPHARDRRPAGRVGDRARRQPAARRLVRPARARAGQGLGRTGLGGWRAGAAPGRHGHPDRRPLDRHQAIVVRGTGDGARTLAFFGDLFMRPWAANPRWVTAFDDFPLDSVAKKAELFAAGRRRGLARRRCRTSATTRSAGWSAIATASASSRSRTRRRRRRVGRARQHRLDQRLAPCSSTGPLTTWRMTPFVSMKNWVGSAKTLYSRRTSPAAVEADRVAQSISIGVRLDVGRRRLLDADPDDLEPALAVRVGERAQDRRLLLAWRAPRREEVQPDDLAAEVGEPDRLARRGPVSWYVAPSPRSTDSSGAGRPAAAPRPARRR